MSNIYIYIIIYFVLISFLSAIITIYDKVSAIRERRRVRERSLFWFAIFGGGLAMYLTMIIIRHKTKHKCFMIGIPLIVIAEAASVAALYFLVNHYA